MARLTRKALRQFPEVMFVAKKKDKNDETEWFQANQDAEACMDDDGPELVAHYKLTGIFKLRKTVRTIESVSVKSR